MTRPRACCAGSEWTRVADLGHAAGIDCVLVRCGACNRPWVHLWTAHASDGSYSPLDETAARELAETAPGPQRKRRLRELLDL